MRDVLEQIGRFAGCDIRYLLPARREPARSLSPARSTPTRGAAPRRSSPCIVRPVRPWRSISSCSGASARGTDGRRGVLERAAGGTALLEEIGRDSINRTRTDVGFVGNGTGFGVSLHRTLATAACGADASLRDGKAGWAIGSLGGIEPALAIKRLHATRGLFAAVGDEAASRKYRDSLLFLYQAAKVRAPG